MPTFKELMQCAPVGQLDASMQAIVARWDAEPTALQILELLDACIHYGAGSSFVVKTLQMLLPAALKEEGTTLEALIPLAHWRTNQPT